MYKEVYPFLINLKFQKFTRCTFSTLVFFRYFIHFPLDISLKFLSRRGNEIFVRNNLHRCTATAEVTKRQRTAIVSVALHRMATSSKISKYKTVLRREGVFTKASH